jgi:predicted transposase YbfD/YdcC
MNYGVILMSEENSTTEQTTKAKILELAERIQDPRRDQFKKHSLTSMIFITLVGSICGADDWVAVADTGEHLKDWIGQYTDLPYGIPSHDTFGRTFGLIENQVFSQLLIDWADHLRIKSENEVVAMDGKTLKGNAKKQEGLKGIHLLNAWSVENGICLGHLSVDKKTNEITVIPKLIEILDLKGCIITTDALNTQKTTVEAIINAKADYVLPVKGNHKGMLKGVKLLFDEAEEKDYRGCYADQFETNEKDHGRVEHRMYSVLDAEDLPLAKEWLNLKSVGRVIRRRTYADRSTFETCYFITSLDIDAKLFAHAVRGHWGVENKLHWSLDIVFREDHSKYRDRVGAQNLSAVRKMALGLLKKNDSVKKSLKRKRFQALTSSEFRSCIMKEFL